MLALDYYSEYLHALNDLELKLYQRALRMDYEYDATPMVWNIATGLEDVGNNIGRGIDKVVNKKPSRN